MQAWVESRRDFLNLSDIDTPPIHKGHVSSLEVASPLLRLMVKSLVYIISLHRQQDVATSTKLLMI